MTHPLSFTLADNNTNEGHSNAQQSDRVIIEYGIGSAKTTPAN